MERLNPKTIQYILTPNGLKEKAEASYKYIVNSYNYISEVNIKIDEILESEYLREISRLVLFGKQDEIYQILKDKLNQKKIDYLGIQTEDELNATVGKEESRQLPIIVWNSDNSEVLDKMTIKHINILDKILL